MSNYHVIMCSNRNFYVIGQVKTDVIIQGTPSSPLVVDHPIEILNLKEDKGVLHC